MADLTCELMLIQNVLTGMGFVPKTLMRLYYDNMSAIYIVQNSVFHGRKHIEVNCHVVWRKYDAGIIEPKHVSSANQLVDLLTKPLERSRLQFLCNKLGVYDVFAPT